VRYETLRKHYGKWFPSEDSQELRKFAATDPSLFRDAFVPLGEQPARKRNEVQCEEGDLNPSGRARTLKKSRG